MIKNLDYFPMEKWSVLSDFLKKHYRPDLALVDRATYEWQFDAAGNRATMISVWDKDRLLSIVGYKKVKLYWDDVTTAIEGAWFMNWMVAKNARTGTGLVTLHRLKELFPVILGIDANETTLDILKMQKWDITLKLPRYFIVLNANETAKFLLDKKKSVLIQTHLFQEVSSSESIRLIDNEEEYKPQWALYPFMKFGTVRDFEFLKWRYTDHPNFDYTLCILGKRHRPAVCVFRIEVAEDAPEVKIGRIVEFFYPADDQGKKEGVILLKQVLSRMKKMGCIYADMICTQKDYRDTLSDVGFVREPDETMILPYRFQPIERAIKKLNLVYWTRKGIPRPDLNEIYLTKSDGDADRLVKLKPSTAGNKRT